MSEESTILTTEANTDAVDSVDTTGGETPSKDSPQNDPAGDGQSDKADDKPVVPESYDLKLPDGSALEASHLETTATFAKELGLSNEHAQKLAERESSIVNEHVDSLMSQHQAQVKQWADDVRADKEIGGSHLESSVNAARKVLQRFGNAELTQELEKSGMGNHPEVIRFLSKVGKAMAEDQPGGGATPATNRISTADALFPTTAKTS